MSLVRLRLKRIACSVLLTVYFNANYASSFKHNAEKPAAQHYKSQKTASPLSFHSFLT